MKLTSAETGTSTGMAALWNFDANRLICTLFIDTMTADGTLRYGFAALIETDIP